MSQTRNHTSVTCPLNKIQHLPFLGVVERVTTKSTELFSFYVYIYVYKYI